jgi:hypothetical protein
MTENTVYQILLSQGIGHSIIKVMIEWALEFGWSTSEFCNYRLINTNSGMPAEFRLDRI